jgi:LysR family glycine cleavage system transcriptional activator
VSRQIKTLETHLGVQLFHRLTRRIELTEAGVSFYSAVTRLLSELAREAESVSRTSEDSRLVVSSGISIASKWLASRLHRLMERHPDLDIQLEVTDNQVDFTQSQVDVALRYGNGTYPRAASVRIMSETVAPVCSPDFRDRMGGLQSPGDLVACRLLHEAGLKADWERWFAMMGIAAPRPRGPGYSHGSMAIEAAIRSEGVVLGRSVLVAEDLAIGRLVELFPASQLEVEYGYDLVYRIGAEDHPRVKAFREWLADEVRGFVVGG